MNLTNSNTASLNLYCLSQKADEVAANEGFLAATKFVGEIATLQLLRDGLNDEKDLIRRASLTLLTYLDFDLTYDLMVETLYKDDSVLIRHQAAFYLGAPRNKRAIQPLIKSLQTDSSPLVRHEAAEALGTIGSSAALEALLKAKQDQDYQVVETAEYSIKQILWAQTAKE